MQTPIVCFPVSEKALPAAEGDPLLIAGPGADRGLEPLGEVRNWRKFSYVSACAPGSINSFLKNCYSFYNSIKLNYEEAERQAEAMLT